MVLRKVVIGAHFFVCERVEVGFLGLCAKPHQPVAARFHLGERGVAPHSARKPLEPVCESEPVARAAFRKPRLDQLGNVAKVNGDFGAQPIDCLLLCTDGIGGGVNANRAWARWCNWTARSTTGLKGAGRGVS